ncbi:unnamed protein product, partial [Ixodes persulcatus]
GRAWTRPVEHVQEHVEDAEQGREEPDVEQREDGEEQPPGEAARQGEQRRQQPVAPEPRGREHQVRQLPA